MKIRYFRGEYKANSLGTNIFYFDLSHMSKVAVHFEKKCSNIHSSTQRKKVEKYLKTRLQSRI